MVTEYAFRQPDTQNILKPLVLAFLMQIIRQYTRNQPTAATSTLSEQILQYMNPNIGHISLKEIAAHFSYHRNYLSTVIRKELGKSFSELLLEQRKDEKIGMAASGGRADFLGNDSF